MSSIKPTPILTLYFSGTGNTEYIAKTFSTRMGAGCHSIEEDLDFVGQIDLHDTLCFCYPIYGSCVPYIMREFVRKHKSNLAGKKFIIFCTQNLFSGDGARVFTDLLAGLNCQIIYAAHFNMPNNICNLFFYPLSSPDRNRKYVLEADKKMIKIIKDINGGIIRKKGFNVFSKHLGLITQRFIFSKEERALMRDVRINSNCNMCLLCTKICPMNNLTVVDNQVVQQGNCTICYRCVNRCPQKAITAAIHGKVKKQYTGMT